MANSVEKLFEQVRSRIANEGLDAAFDWPDAEEKDDDDFVGLPIQLEGGSIEPMSAEARIDEAVDKLPGVDPVPGIPEKDGELIAGGIRARGFEALAFYKSIRFIGMKPFPGLWGAFYLKDALAYLAKEISIAYPGYRDPRQLARNISYEELYGLANRIDGACRSLHAASIFSLLRLLNRDLNRSG